MQKLTKQKYKTGEKTQKQFMKLKRKEAKTEMISFTNNT